MISVVIPTLNEEANIKAIITHTIHMASKPDELEIIVVDAGSHDGTIERIENLSVRAYIHPKFALKKYESLNFGAQESLGEVILFLDADTWLPKAFDRAISKVLKDDKVVGGAFEFSFLKPDLKLKSLTLVNRIRYRIDKTYYGDQAIFVQKSTLEAVGGVPKEALMEAAYLCKALRKRGKLALIHPGIITSPRRFVEHGFFKVVWFDFNMFIRFNLGLAVSSYANKYWGNNLNRR